MSKFITKDNIIIVLLIVIGLLIFNFQHQAGLALKFNHNRIVGNQDELHKLKWQLQLAHKKLDKINSQVENCKTVR